MQKIVYTITIVPDLPNLERIHNVNFCIAIVTFTTWTWSLHIVCTTSPGIITPENISKYDNYHYDDVLYTNQLCPTKKIRKVARSKYCRMMNEHIPRFDHYCWWIDQSVGEENYRYFLFFLLFHPIMLSYGAWGATNFFIEKLEMHQAREEIDMTYWAMLKHVTQEYPALSIVHFFMIFGALCLSAFFGFHIMLTCRNMTTNEYYKWKVIKKIHTDAQKEYQQAVKDGRAETTHSGKGFTNSSSFGLLKLYENISVGCIGANYLSIRMDLNIPHADDSEDFLSMVEDSDEDSDVSNSINDPGSMPINSYNIGIVGNIHEVLFPRSMRARDLEIKEN